VATLNRPLAPDSHQRNRRAWADRAWSVYAAAGGLAAVGYLLLGAGAGKGPYFNLIGLSSLVAILTGIRLHRPRRRLPWYLFAAGMAMFVLGDVFYYTLPQLLHRGAPPFPSTGDIFYLLVYPLLIAGMVLLIRQRNPGTDAVGLIDALIVSTALGLVAWVFLILPYARDPTLTLGRKLISMAYPLMDVLLLGVAARLALDRGNRRPAFNLLILSILCVLAADTAYGLIVLHGTYNTGSPLDVLWIAFYVAWGAAALHPSMQTLSEPAVKVESTLTGWRVVLLVGATLVAPLIQVADSSPGYASGVLVAGAVAIVVLVIVRTAGLIHRYQESLIREGALREAGVAMAAAGSRVEILAAAREAVQTLVGKGAAAHLFLVDASGEILPLPHLQPAPASSSPIFVADLPPTTRAALALREWNTGDAVKAFSTMFGADFGGASTSMYPFIVTNDLRAVVLVSGERPLPDGTATSVSVLVSQVVLALEREQLAEQIHRERSEARFRSLVQMATDVVTVVGVDATILYLSPSVERVLGYPPDGLIGTSLVAIAHPDDRSVVLGLAAPTYGADRSDAVEWRVHHADGSWKYFETVKTNLLDDPNVGGLVLNSRDISERKRAEVDREQLRGRLHQAQRLEAIGQLAAGVAHDFNNLLAVILIYANFVTKRVEARPGQAPVAEDLVLVAADTEKIRLAAERAAALTHQLLIFGRRGDMEPKVLDLNDVVTDLQELLGRTIGEHITLRIRLDPTLSAVRIDPSAIYQVVMNLVINARDAMALGGTLTIETVNVEFDRPLMWGSDLGVGNYVRLRVTDTGCGMPAGVAARAFDPFFTTKPTGEGSGLGLATVYGIVKQAEGDVRLYSEPDHGTVITVYLPATAESMAVPTEEPATAPQLGGIRTILVVEDEEDVREGIARLLADHAYNVVSAPDGAEALRMVAEFDGAIDLLLTDLVMPGMSGGELAETLLLERPGIGVLFMSGYPQGLSEESYTPAAEGVLSKPFTERGLLEAVRESIASPQGGGQ
jgi:PAS domain S-box-containing protein